MYAVTIKGNSLEELKTNIADICFELSDNYNGGRTTKEDIVPVLTTNLSEEIAPIVLAPVLPPVNAPVDEVITPVVVPTQTVQGLELDVEGIPWDARIHSGSKKKVKAGTWTTKRGADVAVIAQVKAELLQGVHQAANPPATPALPVNINTPVVTPQIETVPTGVPAVVTPTPAPALVVPQTTSGHTFDTFSGQFAMILGSLITEGKVTQEYIESLKTYFQVDQIWSVNEAQKLEMFNSFVEYKFIQKVG